MNTRTVNGMSPRPRLLALAVAALAAWSTPACDNNDAVVMPIGGAGGSASAGTNAGGTSGAFPGLIGNGPSKAERERFCMGRGPSITVPGEAGPVCAGKLAENTFRYGLCTCSNVSIGGKLQTDSIDSAVGMSVAKGGSSVGVNGSYSVSGEGYIGGSFITPSAVALASVHQIDGDLKVGKTLSSSSRVQVRRDAWVGGMATAVGGLIVGRDFHSPSGAPLFGAQISGRTVTEAVNVAPPCACDDVLDVAPIVEEARTNNHNALINLDPDRLATTTSPTTLELPCGRFYLSRITADSEVTIKISGRTAIYVGGDVAVSGKLHFDVGPEGELDLISGGSLSVAGSLRLGNIERPAASRMYMSSSANISLAGDGLVVGNIYAPKAAVTAGVTSLQVHGSLFVNSISATDLSVRFDRAITNAGKDCSGEVAPPPQGGECKACGDCSNYNACIDGRCGPCRTDADCCGPFICSEQGQCVVIVN